MPTAPETTTLLRRRLLMTLGALVFIAGVCSVDPPGPAASVAIAAQPVPSPAAATPVATPTQVAQPSMATAPLRAGGGCGLTVGGPPMNEAAVGHCTVLEIGDSLGSDLGWGLAREVAPDSGLNLVQRDKSSTGLAVPSFYNWPAELAADVSRDRPQLVVICLGGNDQQGMEVDGTPVQFATPAWRTAYIARVRRLVQEATGAGAFVLWVGLPVMQQPTYDRGTQELDADFQAGVADVPRAAYLSTRSLFAGPSGSYLPDGVVNGGKTGLRQSDGIHLSLDGENVVATYVLQSLSAHYGVRLTPVAPAVIQRQG